MPARADILRAYRELLFLIKRLPEEKQASALHEARHKTRSNRTVSSEADASEKLKEMVGKIGFLRMTLPRRPGDRYAKSCTFVVRGGNVVEGDAEKESRATDGKMSMEEARQKHHQLLKRQYFGKEPPRMRPPF